MKLLRVAELDEVLAELEVDVDEATLSGLEALGNDGFVLEVELDEIVVDVNDV
jgi:hypothetical protein